MAATASAVRGVRGAAMSVPLGYLRLARPANLVTAAADIAAGAAITRAPASSFGWLMAASVCVYAGGVVLNDFFDREVDAVERPERPIPAGVVPAATAAGVGFTLLLTGIALASVVSARSGMFAAILACTVLAYNAWAKRNAAGPFAMGLCRAQNFLLGLSAVPALLPHLWPLALLPLVYIVAITSLSRGEVHGGSQRTSGMTLLLVTCVLIAVLALPELLGLAHGRAVLPFVALFVARVAPSLWKAWREPTAAAIRAGVHAGVMSLIVLDACLAAAFAGIVEGAAVLSLLVLSAELARFFAVT